MSSISHDKNCLLLLALLFSWALFFPCSSYCFFAMFSSTLSAVANDVVPPPVMASFKERIAKLRAANAAKLAEAEAEKDLPKSKKVRGAVLLVIGSTYQQLVRTPLPPVGEVVTSGSVPAGLLCWKVLCRIPQAVVPDSWLAGHLTKSRQGLCLGGTKAFNHLVTG